MLQQKYHFNYLVVNRKILSKILINNYYGVHIIILLTQIILYFD